MIKGEYIDRRDIVDVFRYGKHDPPHWFKALPLGKCLREYTGTPEMKYKDCSCIILLHGRELDANYGDVIILKHHNQIEVMKYPAFQKRFVKLSTLTESKETDTKAMVKKKGSFIQRIKDSIFEFRIRHIDPVSYCPLRKECAHIDGLLCPCEVMEPVIKEMKMKHYKNRKK